MQQGAGTAAQGKAEVTDVNRRSQENVFLGSFALKHWAIWVEWVKRFWVFKKFQFKIIFLYTPRAVASVRARCCLNKYSI